MPIISIVVPVYNVEKYLPHCIESILSQTYKDFELILVNDGSKDRSGVICDEYASHDDRIRVIHKPNGGVSSARNTGLDNAKGKYVMFCDSDDYAEPEWCEKLLYHIENNPKSWCFCGCHVVDANGMVLEENCIFNRESTYDILPISQYWQIYKTNYSALLWIRIFEMNIIREHNIRFDENMSVSEDVLFNLEYGKHCKTFSVVNIPLYNHRIYLNEVHEHLNGNLPNDMFYINKRIYAQRTHFITADHRVDFETDYFYRFIDDIKKIAKNSSLDKFDQKDAIRQILCSDEFQSALRGADTSKESAKLLILLKCRLSGIVLSLFQRG